MYDYVMVYDFEVDSVVICTEAEEAGAVSLYFTEAFSVDVLQCFLGDFECV